MERIETEEQARRHTPPYTSSIYHVPHDPARCCATVCGQRVTTWQCNRKPKVWYGSLGYCSTHDPNAQIARDTAWHDKYRSEREAELQQYAHETAMREYTAACVELVEQLAISEGMSSGEVEDCWYDAKEILAKKPTNPSNTD